MKFYTVTKREGERLGDIDWNFNFYKEFMDDVWYNCSPQKVREEQFISHLNLLKMVEKDMDKYEATNDGGWPRCGWGDIVSIGMYDGWPYWKPMPSICITHNLGGCEWHYYPFITNIRLKGQYDCLKIPIAHIDNRGLPILV